MKSFSLYTKIYLFMTYGAGLVIFTSHLNKAAFRDPLLLAALCVLASLALILKVEGSTNRSHYTFTFLVYGFTFAVFGLTEVFLVIVVSNIVEWIWNKPPWFIQLFNTGSYILVMAAAGAVYYRINPSNSFDTWQAALAIILSMATFNILNHLMVGIVVWLARGENFRQSGIFDFFPLMLDLTLLYFGASLSIVWKYNPFALVLFLIPIYLIYSTLRVPALERKTEIDSMTGLFNHGYIKNQFINELERANRFDRPLSIILADLDLLRNINNTYGHLAGDEVLIGMAKILKESVREYDVVSRLGGEEFAILMPETTLSQAYERAELIRRAVEQADFTIPTSMTPLRATMSFGVAHRENFNQTADEITHNADLALYHSKLSGRNRSFAYINEAYADFLANNTQSSKPDVEAAKENAEPIRQKPPQAETPEPARDENAELPAMTPSAKANAQESKGKTRGANAAVGIFIGALTLISLLLFAAALLRMPINGIGATFDWPGLIVISVLIVMSEAFSIDLYVRQASISTSAIPILAAYLIFGLLGVALASLLLAISLLIKYRSPFSRFVFNFSNHLLAGTLIAGLAFWTGRDFLGLPLLEQIVLSLAAAILMYLTTTGMVAFGISLDLRQPAPQIWRDQFGWLAPFYVGVGFIVYVMVFGYQHDQAIGLLLVVIPMLLLRISQIQYVERTRGVVTELRDKNQALKKNSDEIFELNEGLLTTLSEIIDLGDPYVLGHSKMVSTYAASIANLLGLNPKQIDLIRKAGLLHDIGKLGISKEILTKPGKLSREEYEIIKEHAALGAALVRNSPSLRPLVPVILHHHEDYNGKGYPDKLAGNQIPIEARIIAVADAIEAMTSDRPYRKALKKEQVIEELKRHSGSQFDPLVVEEAIYMLRAINVDEDSLPNQAEMKHEMAAQLIIKDQPS